MIRVFLVSLGLAALVSIIVYLFSMLKRPIYKYIPSIVLFLLSLIFLFRAKHVTTAWQDLGNIVLSLIASMSCIMTFIVAILLEKRKKIRQK